MKWVGSLFTCWLAVGCMRFDVPKGDIVPPLVVSFTPDGDQVELDTKVSVTFSEPVSSEIVEGYLLVLVPANHVDHAFLADIDYPPLSSTRMSKLVACLYTISADGSRLDLMPLDLLASGLEYAVVVSAEVRDLAGNPLVDELSQDDFGRMVGKQNHAIHRFSTKVAQPDPSPQPDPTPTVEPTPKPTPGVLAELIFTEILANPEGTENLGEYVEIANRGMEDVNVSGFRLDDRAGEGQGDLLTACDESQDPVIRPGKVALLVGQAFVPPPDMQPDTLLLCSPSTTITPYGLKNTGEEVLVLKDSYEREVCRYGGWVDMSNREGCAATRLDLEAPDEPDNWAIPDTEPCRSPGWLP